MAHSGVKLVEFVHALLDKEIQVRRQKILNVNGSILHLLHTSHGAANVGVGAFDGIAGFFGFFRHEQSQSRLFVHCVLFRIMHMATLFQCKSVAYVTNRVSTNGDGVGIKVDHQTATLGKCSMLTLVLELVFENNIFFQPPHIKEWKMSCVVGLCFYNYSHAALCDRDGLSSFL